VGKEDGDGCGQDSGLKQAGICLGLGAIQHQKSCWAGWDPDFRFCNVRVKEATRTVGSEAEFNSCRPIVGLSDKT
jgi:hypothetical protein